MSIRSEQQAKTNEKIEQAKKNGLQTLSLVDSALDSFPIEICQLTDLVFLDLSNSIFCDEEFQNKIRTIPPEINNLKKLKTLKINNGKLETIPSELSELISLKTIEIENNDLIELPSSLVKIRGLENVKFSKNNFENIPPEIANKTLEAIRNFFKEIEEKDYLYEVKLLLVGEGRVGKTSLSKALRINDYILEDEQSTEGINVQQWLIPKDEFSNYVAKDFILNIWDFGGQEIYHATHQFFLTKRSLYLLVTESRKEDRHEDFYYWLNIIKLLGDKSPVVIVMNKSDQPTKELPIKEYQDKFENLLSYHKVSCKPDKRHTLLALKDEIKRIISDSKLMPHIGTALPKKWVDIRMELDNLKKSGNDHINLDKYLEICKKHYYGNDVGAMYLSEYLHDLGVILHFQKDIDLRDTIVLNNEWVTKGVYKILDNQKILDNHGRFNNEDLIAIWSDENYKNKTKELISLMKNQKFELCFELGNGEYLAPQLLPVDEINYQWRSNIDNIYFEFRYKFMPKGILTRTIVKRNKDICNNTYWRYGVLLQYDNTRAIIKERYLENKITVQLEGDHKKELLSIIRKTINEIHSDFNNIEVDEMIPCNCEECKGGNMHFYKFSYLRRLLQRNLPARCQNSLLEVKVTSLIDDVINTEVENESNKTTVVNINTQGGPVTMTEKLETSSFVQKNG